MDNQNKNKLNMIVQEKVTTAKYFYKPCITNSLLLLSRYANHNYFDILNSEVEKSSKHYRNCFRTVTANEITKQILISNTPDIENMSKYLHHNNSK